MTSAANKKDYAGRKALFIAVLFTVLGAAGAMRFESEQIKDLKREISYLRASPCELGTPQVSDPLFLAPQGDELKPAGQAGI